MASETGRVVYMPEPGEIEFREYPVPEPEPGAIVTEIVRANVCGSELHIFEGGHPHVQDSVLGHEALCRVAALGEDVETDYAGEPIAVGDLIVPAYFKTCRHCAHCGRGDFRLCENAYEHWSQPPDVAPHFHGTFGTHYYVTPDQFFFKVPSGIDEAVVASANCALSQMLYGLEHVDVTMNETVVIQGAGGLGLNAIAIAKEKGADVIMIEGVDERLDRANAFGADHTIDFREYETVDARADRVRALTDGLGADVGVEVAGVPDAFSEGPRLLRTGGRYLEVGNIVPGPTTDFDPGYLTRSSISIDGIVRYDPWYLKQSLEFLAANGEDYPFDELLSEFALEDVRTALDHSADRDLTRASLIPNDD